MRHVELGRTDLRVSEFGMGCGNFGGIGSAPEFFGQGESEQEAFRLLDQAVEMGINYLDTADAYGGGRSESTIGRWLATKDGPTRDRLLISSKVGNPVDDGPGGPLDPDRQGLSRRHVLRQVDASLTRLGVDHLDMYLAHEIDPDTPLEETVAAFDEVVRAGKVRAVGISNHAAWQVTKALWISERDDLARFEWVQNSFSLLDQADQAETLALCRDQGLGFTPFSPLAGGWLTGKYRHGAGFPAGSRMTTRPEPYRRYENAATFRVLDRLGAMAAERSVSTAGLALAWLRRHPDVTSSVIGPRHAGHFAAVTEALELELDEADWRAVGALFEAEEVTP
jgi:aryl-alcohol dehydrogenase-like predicted oxidoreductase